MSGKGKAKGLAISAAASAGGASRSQRAGLIFPVGRIGRWMKDGGYAARIGKGAPIFLAAVLEYLTFEVLEMAGNHARDSDKKRVTPQHIQYAVRSDQEMATLLSSVTIAKGGVNPMSSDVLHARKKDKDAAKEDDDF
eukprot:Protomagalhaensia_wolfi_Nauph_80__6164@NODE_904_length_1896_cov_403_341949_g681_i0_p3_GENE_NODE_904_length_1896_cov_403_341949_g681_i0NODE_904_length_1896_cov_403_341949_g681_i0_p3_ORF_typecomplete_len138_score27_31Histone/PF00125_24/3_6e16CBFD_NFYB_HMF/PF00808_23/6_9e06Histone_H2A_C/PF16211_5/0_00017TAF/PF02969_17/0_0046DUF3071/PF11268_8/0_071DC_STAMP/PF07782_13/0_24_NODE_904_length_1896_cov_403_341949_g681_i07641177